MNKNIILIAALLLIIIISGGTFLLGYLWGNNWLFNDNPTQITPTIDGIINAREWKRTSYKHSFYLDVDNSFDPVEGKRNVDGWNYMYIGEDENFYYVALDLCSDRTNNKVDEWISFFLANRLPEFYYSNLALHSLVDNGFEYLFYNVSSDIVMPNIQYDGFGSNDHYDIPIVPETDLIYPIKGIINSTYLDFWRSYDDKNYTIQSIFSSPGGSWLEGQFLDLQFGINIEAKMPRIDTAYYMSNITDMDLQLLLTSDLTSDPIDHLDFAERFYCCIAEHGSKPGNFSEAGSFLANSHLLNFPAFSYTPKNIDLNHTAINATTGMFYFAIHCWNELNVSYPTNYKLFIDNMNLKITTLNYGTTIGTTILPTNRDLSWSYGQSENCAEEHRMFEFKVAKSEFPNLEDDLLYICVAGYGTMLITGTDYWQYPIYGYPTNPIFYFLDDDKDFAVFDMSIT